MSVHIDGDTPCPNSDDYCHDWYFGCVPNTFNGSTGRAKGVKQELSAEPIDGHHRYLWPGGCNGVGLRRTSVGRWAKFPESAYPSVGGS